MVRDAPLWYGRSRPQIWLRPAGYWKTNCESSSKFMGIFLESEKHNVGRGGLRLSYAVFKIE